MAIENIWIDKNERMPDIGQTVFVVVTEKGKAYNPYVAKYMGEGLFDVGGAFWLDKLFGFAKFNGKG